MKTKKEERNRKGFPYILGGSLVVGLLMTGCGHKVQIADEMDYREPHVKESVEKESAYTSVEGLHPMKGQTIALVLEEEGDEFWEELKDGAEAAIEEINESFDLEGEDALTLLVDGASEETDLENQINLIDTILAENPDAMCIAAQDRASCEPQLEAAEENGIPVIMLESGVDSELVQCICQSDNMEAGILAADQMSRVLHADDQILLVGHGEFSMSCNQRILGFKAEMQASHGDLQLLEPVYDKEEVELSEELYRLLEENPEIKGIFCTNQKVTGETLEAMKNREKDGKSLPVLIGFDAEQEQLEAIAEGIQLGSIMQDPYSMGFASVCAAVRAGSGETTDLHIYTETRWINRMDLEISD